MADAGVEVVLAEGGGAGDLSPVLDRRQLVLCRQLFHAGKWRGGGAHGLVEGLAHERLVRARPGQGGPAPLPRGAQAARGPRPTRTWSYTRRRRRFDDAPGSVIARAGTPSSAVTGHLAGELTPVDARSHRGDPLSAHQGEPKAPITSAGDRSATNVTVWGHVVPPNGHTSGDPCRRSQGAGHAAEALQSAGHSNGHERAPTATPSAPAPVESACHTVVKQGRPPSRLDHGLDPVLALLTLPRPPETTSSGPHHEPDAHPGRSPAVCVSRSQFAQLPSALWSAPWYAVAAWSAPSRSTGPVPLERHASIEEDLHPLAVLHDLLRRVRR